jgi:hypothetical protein
MLPRRGTAGQGTRIADLPRRRDYLPSPFGHGFGPQGPWLWLLLWCALARPTLTPTRPSATTATATRCFIARAPQNPVSQSKRFGMLAFAMETADRWTPVLQICASHTGIRSEGAEARGDERPGTVPPRVPVRASAPGEAAPTCRTRPQPRSRSSQGHTGRTGGGARYCSTGSRRPMHSWICPPWRHEASPTRPPRGRQRG